MANNPPSHFPSQMSVQDFFEMSSAVPEECATSLQTTTADHGQLATTIRAPPATPGGISNGNVKLQETRCINYEAPLTTKLQALLETHALSDVTLLVGPDKVALYAHKLILALSSPVFTAMFYGDLANSHKPQVNNEKDTKSLAEENKTAQDDLSQSSTNQEEKTKNNCTSVEIPDCTVPAMKAFLRFIYYNAASESTSNIVEDEHALSLLYAARKYNVYGLEDLCIVSLSKSLSAENAFEIATASSFFDIPSLDVLSWEFIEDNVVDVVNTHLDSLTQDTIQKILSKDKLNCKEVDLFKVFMKWAEKECTKINLDPTAENIRSSFQSELKLIRFPTMSGSEFADVVVPTGVLTMEQVAQIFTAINSSVEKRDEITKGNDVQDPNSTSHPGISILKGMIFSCHKRTPNKRPGVLSNAQDFRTRSGNDGTRNPNAINGPPVFAFMAGQSANSVENNQISFLRNRAAALASQFAGSLPQQAPMISALPAGIDYNSVIQYNTIPIPIEVAPVAAAAERHRGRSRTRRHRRRETVENNDED